MLIAALLNTFVPGLFNIGGLTEALFTPKGANYVVGLVSFCSATSIDIKIASVLKKQGVLLLVKIIVCFVFGYGYISLFGQEGIMGVSAIAFIVAICSVNPSVYLAIVSDYGDEDDKVAFGLVGLVCIPAFLCLFIVLLMVEVLIGLQLFQQSFQLY